MGRKVLHVGDRVAAVVAESPEIAEAAVKKIQVDYDVLKPVLTIEEAMAPGAPIVRNAAIEYIHGAPADLDNSNLDPREEKIIYRFSIGADPRKNLAASAAGGIGDINKGFEEADVILEREYETTQVHCTPLEPHVVYTRMDGDRLIIHASTQTPWCIRRTVARALDISENKIRVIKERVGGGFGSKQDVLLEEVAAYLTWTTGRSILFRYTREEDFYRFEQPASAEDKGKIRRPQKWPLNGYIYGRKSQYRAVRQPLFDRSRKCRLEIHAVVFM